MTRQFNKNKLPVLADFENRLFDFHNEASEADIIPNGFRHEWASAIPVCSICLVPPAIVFVCKVILGKIGDLFSLSLVVYSNLQTGIFNHSFIVHRTSQERFTALRDPRKV